MKILLFTTDVAQLQNAYDKMAGKQPVPLNDQYKKRKSKDDAVECHKERQRISNSQQLFPQSKHIVNAIHHGCPKIDCRATNWKTHFVSMCAA